MIKKTKHRSICFSDLLNNYIECIGEALFTLFASLTYAYHYLMTLIK